MAKPSNPSVRLTALLDPTMTKIANGRNIQPKSTRKLFVNGINTSELKTLLPCPKR